MLTRKIDAAIDAIYDNSKMAAMQALSDQYAGDPFRFLPQKEMLEERLPRLRKDRTATEEDFKALYDDAAAFDREVKATRGIHQRIDLSVLWNSGPGPQTID